MRLPPARRLRAAGPSRRLLGACVLLLLFGLGCHGHARPSCNGGPVAGAITLWAECSVNQLMDGSVSLVLTNATTEPCWFYHECGDEVPWPDELQDDGTWLRLLPGNFFLPISCHHVMELAPGESMELPMSTQHVARPGVYRAEMMIALGCVDVHEPLHVPHSCASVDFLVSEAFELR